MLGWIDTLLQGILLGGLYSLYATGLSVIFGIMRLVNLAHGDLIVLAAFLMLALAAVGVPVVLAVAVVSRLMVLNFGRKIIEGEPRSVMASAEVREIYMGIAA